MQMGDQMNEIAVVKKNPLLERIVIPGETFRLPSGGIFYTHGEVDSTVTNGEIQVNPMTALDEIVMKSPNNLINGNGITDVLMKCMPQIINANDIFAKDVDYLMLCLRKVTYGDVVDVNFNHECSETAKSHTYTTTLSKFINEAKQIDPTTINSMYSVTVDSGQVVNMHPVRFKDIMKMMQASSMKVDNSTVEQIQNDMFTAVVSIISSVDGVEDKDFILDWAKTIPTTWFSKIANSVDKSSDWGPTTEFKDICKDCGEEIVISVSLNPLTFFTQSSVAGTT
jgi:hypothetical protein